jgi:hypothetical protein
VVPWTYQALSPNQPPIADFNGGAVKADWGLLAAAIDATQHKVQVRIDGRMLIN